MLLLELVIASCICLLIWFVYDRVVTGKNLPPGPIRIPLFGNMVQLAMRSKEPPYLMFQNLCKEYGSIMTVKFGLLWQVIVDDPEMIRQVLSSDNWSDRSENAFVQERSYGKSLGILWGNGEPWKELRRFSIRTLRDFGFGKQKSQEIVMEEELKELMNKLNDTIRTDNNVVNMNQFFTVSVLNILWSMMAGIRFSHDDQQLQSLVIKISDVMKLITASGNVLMGFPFLSNVLRKLTGYGQIRIEVIAKLQSDFQKILIERRSEGFYKDDQRDFIDVFLLEIDKHRGDSSDLNVYTDQQFITTVLDLFVAGSETTANSLEFAILFMILNRQVQEKVQKEIDQVVGFSRFPNAADKASMPYTEATILEIQRMANIVPMIMRAPNQDVNLKSYKIKKGTFTVLNTYTVHQSPTIWRNPHEFQPERFLDANQKIINADKLLVFGTGKRICLGEILAKATLFTYFTAILQNYTFESSPSHPNPTLSEPRFGITMAPKPYFAQVRPRVFKNENLNRPVQP